MIPILTAVPVGPPWKLTTSSKVLIPVRTRATAIHSYTRTRWLTVIPEYLMGECGGMLGGWVGNGGWVVVGQWDGGNDGNGGLIGWWAGGIVCR